MRFLLVLALLTSPALAETKPFCEEKRECREMRDCAEARFHFEQCGQTQLDRDGDGIPCEELCRFN